VVGVAGEVADRDGVDEFTALFAESVARAVVAVRPEHLVRFAELCETHGVPMVALGTTGGEELRVTDRFEIPLSELREAHESTLPAVFAG
jgi:phosphoribosylformylglycinamidine synthase